MLNDFLQSYLLLAFGCGVTFTAAAFLAHRDSTWRTRLRYTGGGLLLAAVLGAVALIVGPPGGEDTVVEPDHLVPENYPEHELLAVLQMSWDSELNADWPISDLAARISEIAYLPPPEAEVQYKSLGFTAVGVVLSDSMVGYVATIDDFAVVAFRGTDDIPDWIQNLKIDYVQTPHGGVHRGFYESFQALKHQVRERLKQSNSTKVWITGHSLGGALAVICAEDLVASSDVEVCGLVTFGQPMVGKRDFAKHMEQMMPSKFAHFVNASDAVPRIPPGYKHCGSLVWFTDDAVRRSYRQRLMSAPGSGSLPPFYSNEEEGEDDIEPMSRAEFRALQEDLKDEEEEPTTGPDGMPLMMGTLPLLDDHAMAIYIEKIRTLLGIQASSSE